MSPGRGGGLGVDVDDDEKAADEDAPALTERVVDGARERQGAETADVDDGEDQAGRGAGLLTELRVYRYLYVRDSRKKEKRTLREEIAYEIMLILRAVRN